MAESSRIEELRKRYHENPRRFFAPLANEYRKSGALDRAIALCQKHLGEQPGNMNGLIVYGQSLFEDGRHEEARAPFEAALELDPENLIALRHLGDIARLADDHPTARKWYERVLEFDRRNDEVIALLERVGGVRPEPATGPYRPSVITVASSVNAIPPEETSSAPTPPRTPTPVSKARSATPVRSTTPAATPLSSVKTVEVTPMPRPGKRASLLDIDFDFAEGASVELDVPSAPASVSAPTPAEVQPTAASEQPSLVSEIAPVEPSAEFELTSVQPPAAPELLLSEEPSDVLELPSVDSLVESELPSEPLGGATAAEHGVDLNEMDQSETVLSEDLPETMDLTLPSLTQSTEVPSAREFIAAVPPYDDDVPDIDDLPLLEPPSGPGRVSRVTPSPGYELPEMQKVEESYEEGVEESREEVEELMDIDTMVDLPALSTTLGDGPADPPPLMDFEPGEFDPSVAGEVPRVEGFREEDYVGEGIESLPELQTNQFGTSSLTPDETLSLAPEETLSLTPAGTPSLTPNQTPVIVTETMAKLYVEQGFTSKAIEVYKQLLSADPDDVGLQARLADLEREASQSIEFDAPVETYETDEVPSADAMLAEMSFDDLALETPEPMDSGLSAPVTSEPVVSGPSAREFFAMFAQRSVTPLSTSTISAEPDSGESYSIPASLSPLDELFGIEVAPGDQRAANSLSGVGTLSAPSGGSSLDALFGTGEHVVAARDRARMNTPRASEKLKFDQFFSASSSPQGQGVDKTPSAEPSLDAEPEMTLGGLDAGAAAEGAPEANDAPGGDDDLGQFQDWLKGLTQ